jgi:hypothetical protein
MKSIVISLSAALLLSSCAAYRAQHPRTATAAAPASASSASMAPAKASADDEPMAMVPERVVAALQSKPLAVKQTLLISEIDRYIDELKQAGQYDCCVKPACRQCAMSAGECHCREVISANGPCCGECTQAWVDGKGNTEGVDREQVLAHLGCLRELYDKKVPEGMTPPGEKKPD